MFLHKGINKQILVCSYKEILFSNTNISTNISALIHITVMFFKTGKTTWFNVYTILQHEN